MPRDVNGPSYRFHGSTPPEPGRRTPIRAQLAATVDETGPVTLRLYDPIDSWGGDWGVSAKEFADVLAQIPADTSEIRLHINSPGGEVYEGVAILNQLRAHPAPVVAVIDGLAASAASFIATGADQVIMGRNSQLMIHDAWGVCIGPAADMRDLATRLDQLSNNIASIYQARAGGTLQDWRDAMLAETWYSADEAVKAGLADSVDGPVEDAPQNRFDLSVFKHQGRAEAPAPLIPSATDRAAARINAEQRRRHNQNRLAITAARHGLPLPPRSALTPDDSMLTQAMAWFTAIDNIVDEAQEALAAHLGVPSPDPDDTDAAAA